MRLYAIQYALASQYEAECDDPPKPWHLGLDGMASPQVAALATDETLGRKVLEVKDNVVEDLRDDYAHEPDVWVNDVESGLQWHEGEWHYPEAHEPYRPHQVLWLRCLNSVMAVVIVQLVEAE